MAYWKFTCTWDTERECMIRRLFGNHQRETPEGELLDVEQNDSLFLHRMMTKQSNRHGYLLGPFVATTSAKKNINPDAWNHLGSIDWQVEIDWVEPVYSLNLEDMVDEDGELEMNVTQYAQKFSEVQGIFFEGQLRHEGNLIINYP